MTESAGLGIISQKGRKDVIRCPKDSLGETQEIGRVLKNQREQFALCVKRLHEVTEKVCKEK